MVRLYQHLSPDEQTVASLSPLAAGSGAQTPSPRAGSVSAFPLGSLVPSPVPSGERARG